MEEEAA